jgi:hypothetical protein
MGRFEIAGDDEHLLLTQSLGYQRMAQGCLLITLTFSCITILGMLAVVQGNVVIPNRSAYDDLNLLNPRGNHFAFLWLIATVLMGVLLPIYVAKVYRAKTVFSFDRTTGLFSHNGRPVTQLSRIESVRIRHTEDPDHRVLHKLIIVHSDGFEVPLDDWYDEMEMNYVAREISEFLGVRIVGVREVEVEESILRDLRQEL